MSPTGEQPIAKAEPALSLSFDRILALIGLFGSLAAVYAGFRITQNDVERNTVRIEKLEASREAEKGEHSALTTRVAVVEAAVFDIKASLQRIEGKLDGRTTNANYRPRPTP